jgi:hypothetical protein
VSLFNPAADLRPTFRRWPRLFWVALFVLALGLSRGALAVSAASKPIMVYYMPWYVAKPYSPDWGWHWTMDHFKPDVTNASGERQIASWYYPLIGPYDSSDPAVLEYHVLLMKLAGVDGVIVDWYGFAPHFDYGVNNAATARLFDFTRKAGLKFAVCYEDQTVRHMIEGNYLQASNAISHAQHVMLHLQANYFTEPSYFRLKGKPVLMNFGPQYFMASTNWESIFSALAPSNQPAFFTEDNRLAAGAGAFNWPPMWMSQSPGTAGVLSSAALKTYLAAFDQKAATWPAFISSAFPRFHDIYQKAGVRNFWGYLGDGNGDTLRETLGRAITNSSGMVQIVTWNDFGEGTVVEPTREYGFRDLGLIQDFRRQYFDKTFPYRTNDLSTALRFYQARKEQPAGSRESVILDGVFSTILSGKLDVANEQLDKLTKPALAGDLEKKP